MPNRSLLALPLCALALLAPALARAADPIMPLSDVRSGMRCTGLSVVRGTQPASFDVEVLDVVAGGAISSDPLILVRVSGPAVEPGGIAEGFSGSPVYCPDAGGIQRNVGALAYGVGQYGDTVGLATPIEQIIGEPVSPARRLRTAPRLVRRAKPLGTPLSVGGLAPELAGTLARAGQRVGRVVRAVPAGPVGGLAPQPLVPGASVVAGLAAGDISIGGLGTVSYVDGNAVWAFGHPFDDVGARQLLLQDAYVYTVVDNPVNVAPVAVSYKLGAPVNTRGTLTDDAPAGVVGQVGVAPPVTALNVTARDTVSGRLRTLGVSVADESAVSNPTGPKLPLIAPLVLDQADLLVLRGSPPQQSARLCARLQLARLAQPLRFCNRYVGGAGTGDAALDGSFALLAMLNDLTSALDLTDAYQGPALRVTGMDMDLSVHRGLDLATLRDGSVPGRVRAGAKLALKLVSRTPGGARVATAATVRIPRSTRPGTYALRLSGQGPDTAETGLLDELAQALQGDQGSGDQSGATVAPVASLDELEARFAEISRFDGVRVKLGRPGKRGGRLISGFRDPARRLSGQLTLKLRVVR